MPPVLAAGLAAQVVLPPPAVINNPAEVAAALGFFVFMGLVVIGPIGRAIADRLRGRSRDRALDSAELEALRDELAGLRQQVSELAERQDFAERLLAQVKERGQLPAPKEP